MYTIFTGRCNTLKCRFHGPDNGTKPGGERHRREAPSQAKFGYGEREALPQVRCAGKFQARSARNAEREALPQAKFGRGERAALPHVCCAEEFQARSAEQTRGARSAPTGEIWTWGARSAPACVLCGRISLISGAKRRTRGARRAPTGEIWTWGARLKNGRT